MRLQASTTKQSPCDHLLLYCHSGLSHFSTSSLLSPGLKLTFTSIEPIAPFLPLPKSLNGNMLSSAKYTGR